jgi:hypothetical protein
MIRTLILLLVAATLHAAGWRAGVVRLKITPETPIWMSGYGNRNKPSEGVMQDLWAKSLALEDEKRNRVVIVTTDLIGLPRTVSEQIAAECLKRYGLERERLLLNSSHTHTGPMVRENLITMFDLAPEEKQRIQAYGQRLSEAIIDAVGTSIENLAPAELSYGVGKAGFAINRRQPTPKGIVIGVNPDGPVDHDVPVLAVRNPHGKLLAALFGYACHNTTLTGEFYRISGDYAGFAQAEFEKAHPEAAGMFLMLAGGDQNPNPRSREDLARQHGKTLAAAVDEVLAKPMKPVAPRARAAFRVVDLPFAVRSRDDFEKELTSDVPARVRRAKEMIRAFDERRPVRRVPYPVQAVRLGETVTYIALGGELVVGYSLRAKKEFPAEATVVAGYSNDVMCYIPTEKVLAEGGYEADLSMVYYGQPGPFAPGVEDRIFDAIRAAMKRVGRGK